MLLVGTGKAEITPKIGDLYPMSNGTIESADSTGGYVTSIDGQLFVRVVYMEDDDKNCFVLAMADTEAFTREMDLTLRHTIEKSINVPFERVRINATHTHTSMRVYVRVHEILEKYGFNFIDIVWLEKIRKAIIKAAIEAKNSVQPVSIKGGFARIEGIAANRTVFLKEGTVATRYGGESNLEIRQAPEGLIDPEVAVLQFQSKFAEPVLTIFNYACHATNYPGKEEGRLLVSPDFPGYATETIENKIGGTAFFLQGASGNIGTGKYRTDCGLETSKLMGKTLANGVFKALESVLDCTSGKIELCNWNERVELREDLPTMEVSNKQLDEMIKSGIRDARIWQTAALIQVLEDAENISCVDMFIMRCGEFCLVGMPAESFIESALAIKSASPYPITMVGGYFDSTLWYIPTRKAFNYGGYEAAGGWSYTAPGTSEQLVRAVIQRISMQQMNF